MRRMRPYLIGGLIGAAALAMLPLAGLLDHRATEAGQLLTGYQWLANRQSVTLRSMTLVPPDLSDPARAARAAGHYERACAICHGSPAARPALFTAALSPPPPPLAGALRWRPPARQFQTIKYGLHATAMPGWPVDSRDDEVWDMVAFLARLPGLDAAGYRQAAGQGRCTDCHGSRGEGRDGIPRLDIHTAAYLRTALRDYRLELRASAPMMTVARSLTDAEIEAYASDFAAPAPPASAGVMGDTSEAARIARHGLPGRDIPACLSCHGATARTDYPRLAGQDEGYLKQQLTLFATLGEVRGGSRAHIMAPIAAALTPEQIDALAAYFAGLN